MRKAALFATTTGVFTGLFIGMPLGANLFTARADVTIDPLAGSTDAIVIGPSGFSDPSTGFDQDVYDLYLLPLGYSGDLASTTSLYTPESSDYGPSVTADESDITAQVEQLYNAGDISANDPLTIFSYSQSAVAVGDDEETLFNYGIPSSDLNLVIVGDTANPFTGFLATWGDTPLGKEILTDLGWGNLIDNTTPDNYYPTEDFTITNDYWADYLGAATTDPFTSSTDMYIHEAYLGLTAAEIAAGETPALTTVDGLSTFYDIPALTSTQLWDALVNAAETALNW